MAFEKCHQISTHPIFDNLTASLIKMMGSSQWYDVYYTDPKQKNPPAWFTFDPPVSGSDSKESNKKRFPMPLEPRTLDGRSRAGPKPEEKEINGRRRLGASLGTSGPPPGITVNVMGQPSEDPK
jgi:hypothetical protein